MFYPIEITKTTAGEYRAFCRDLPKLYVSAATIDEIRDLVSSAVPATMELHYRRERKAIPLPSDVQPNEKGLYIPIRVQAKILLWNLLIERGMTLNDLAAMLEVSASQAQRLVDLTKKGASIEAIEDVLNTLGKGLIATTEDEQ